VYVVLLVSIRRKDIVPCFHLHRISNPSSQGLMDRHFTRKYYVTLHLNPPKTAFYLSNCFKVWHRSITTCLTPCSKVLFEKLKVTQLVKKFLWNPNDHCCVQRNPPLVPILSQMHPVHIFVPYFLRFILIISYHLSLGLPNGVLPWRFPVEALYIFINSLISYRYLNLKIITSSLLLKIAWWQA
jgi:hypothetical protein